MNLREFLAVEVMGWSKPYQKNSHSSNPWFYADDMPVNQWRPDELIEQAIMCARKVPHLIGVEFDYRPAGIICTVLTYPNSTEGVQHFSTGLEETESKALSIAVADAAGWKDE